MKQEELYFKRLTGKDPVSFVKSKKRREQNHDDFLDSSETSNDHKLSIEKLDRQRIPSNTPSSSSEIYKKVAMNFPSSSSNSVSSRKKVKTDEEFGISGKFKDKEEILMIPKELKLPPTVSSCLPSKDIISATQEKQDEGVDKTANALEFYECTTCQIQIPIPSDFTHKTVRLNHTSSMIHQLKKNEPIDPNDSSNTSIVYYDFNPETYKGYQLLKKEGWQHGQGLGAESQGRKQPLAIRLKSDRHGLGNKHVSKKKVTHEHQEIEKVYEKTRPLTTQEQIQKSVQEEKRRQFILAYLNRGNS